MFEELFRLLEGGKARKKRRRRKGSRAEDLVAKRYERAGYTVHKHYVDPDIGEIDVFVEKGSEVIAVEVKSGKQVLTRSDIMKIVRKARALARRLKKKVKITLWIGPNVKLTRQAWELVRYYGIRVRYYTK